MPSEIPATDDLLKKIVALEKKAELLRQHLANQSANESALQQLANTMSLLVCSDDALALQFQENLLAFKRYYPDIYDFFKDYQPQKYLIDTVDGFANILDVTTQQPIYPYPAYLMANAQLNSYKKAPQSTQSMFYLNEKNEGNFTHSTHLNKIIQLVLDREIDNVGEVRGLSKDISSMIIFGVGVGYHIELLTTQHQISSLYLIEPELDVFYASLYSANWQGILRDLANKKTNLHISLGPQEDEFFDDLLEQSFINGRYDAVKTFGYVHYNTADIAKLLVQYRERFYEMVQGWGFFDDAVMSISHLLGNLKQQVPLLKKEVVLNDDMANTPVFIVGNGPSLDSLVALLRANQDKALIISCGSALSALHKYGIMPDFHCEQERTYPVAEKIDYYCPKEIIDQLVLLAPSTVHPAVFEKFQRSLMAAKGQEPSTALLLQDEVGGQLFAAHPYINPTVANTALSIAAGMGFKNFYLIGIDLGYKSGEKHHSSKSFYYDQNEQDLNIYEEAAVSTLTAKGNFGGTFVCDTFFNMSRIMLERLLAENKALNCYNLCDGAFIAGSHALPAAEITIAASINKTEIIAKTMVLASYIDHDHKLYDSLLQALDYQGFQDLCDKLVAAADKPVLSAKNGLEVIRQQTAILRDTKLFISDHFYMLLNGSVMHMQAMLTRLLYEALDEAEALADFKKGLKIYQEFLCQAPEYYQKNATVPHFMDTEWLDPFRK